MDTVNLSADKAKKANFRSLIDNLMSLIPTNEADSHQCVVCTMCVCKFVCTMCVCMFVCTVYVCMFVCTVYVCMFVCGFV